MTILACLLVAAFYGPVLALLAWQTLRWFRWVHADDAMDDPGYLYAFEGRMEFGDSSDEEGSGTGLSFSQSFYHWSKDSFGLWQFDEADFA